MYMLSYINQCRFPRFALHLQGAVLALDILLDFFVRFLSLYVSSLFLYIPIS